MSEEQQESTTEETKKEANEKEVLVVTTKVKSYIKSKECMTSGDAIEALNEKIYRLIDEAIERTKANKRATVKAIDF